MIRVCVFVCETNVRDSARRRAIGYIYIYIYEYICINESIKKFFIFYFEN